VQRRGTQQPRRPRRGLRAPGGAPWPCCASTCTHSGCESREGIRARHCTRSQPPHPARRETAVEAGARLKARARGAIRDSALPGSCSASTGDEGAHGCSAAENRRGWAPGERGADAADHSQARPGRCGVASSARAQTSLPLRLCCCHPQWCRGPPAGFRRSQHSRHSESRPPHQAARACRLC